MRNWMKGLGDKADQEFGFEHVKFEILNRHK
jgi:hypothetical protein